VAMEHLSERLRRRAEAHHAELPAGK